MNPLQMHIGVDLILQKANSNILSVIKPQEKDFFLNDELTRYITQRAREISDEKRLGFQGDIKRYTDLKDLIGPPIELPVYNRDAESVFAFLPSNCFRPIRSYSLTKDLCGNTYNATITSTPIYYAIYKLLDSGVNNYQHFELKINGVSVFKTDDYPQFASGLPVPEMKFEMIDFMLEAIRTKGYEAKYENFDPYFYRESIIIKSSSSLVLTAIYNGSSNTINGASDSFDKINPITVDNVSGFKNILYSTDEYIDMLNSNFGGTMYNAPISILENKRIAIFHKKKFIVSSIKLSFIRIPRKISLPLNQSCDLDESVHQEIVDNVGRRLAAISSAENYQQLIAENLKKE